MRDKKGDVMTLHRQKRPRPLNENERKIVRDFFDKNSAFLHFIYMLFCTDKTDESDIIQECLVRIMNNIDTFLSMPPQRRKAYTIPIIEHLCIDKSRREKRITMVPISDDIECDKTKIDSEEHLSIILLSRKLPERDWYLLKSIYLDGMPKEELAQTLHCSVDSLRMMVSRARKNARAVLDDSQIHDRPEE